MAQPRHKRDTNARRIKLPIALVAAPVALLVTGPAIAVGVLASEPVGLQPFDIARLQAEASLVGAADSAAADRDDIVSRSGGRGGAGLTAAAPNAQADRARERAEERATALAVRRAKVSKWTTTELNLWGASDKSARQIGVIEGGEKVLVTGRTADGRVELAVQGQSRWVTAGYLSDDKPTAALAIGGACTNGTSVSGGPNVVSVHQAVCAAFPSITSYGTYRAGSGDHASGRAVDIMVSGPLGWDIANFVRSNYAALGVSYVIYAQHIWSVDRGGEGWRAMSNRGSTTANHYDHVHVSTY